MSEFDSPTATSPQVSGPPRRWWRRHPILAIGTFAALLAIVVVAACNLWVRLSAAEHEYSVADAPSAPVALILGAGLTATGTPSAALQVRLDDAIALYLDGKARVLLVSGDNGTTSHDEPTAMRDYLVQHGVPSDKVVLDYAGFDTWDSCVRAKEIFGVDRALVVTQQFHLARAVFLCRQAGIDADGVADAHDVGNRVSFALREIPAAVKAGWDAILHPEPRFLGAPEPGVRLALNS